MTVEQDSKTTDVDDVVADTAEPSDADVENTTEATDAPEAPVAPENRRWWQSLGRLWFPLTLAVALVVSGALAGWLYFAQYRVDQQTGKDASDVVLNAAKDGTVALLSYAPESLDKDFSAAKSHLTGEFLSYYEDFTQKIVTPAAKEKAVKTSANVVRAAVAEIHPDSAVVLVFVNQATTSSQNPNGSFAASAVKVGLTKLDGNWLISTFDPV
ncbi:twin-arginine translocation pathway signal [Mycolicibacterium sp. XJ870]